MAGRHECAGSYRGNIHTLHIKWNALDPNVLDIIKQHYVNGCLCCLNAYHSPTFVDMGKAESLLPRLEVRCKELSVVVEIDAWNDELSEIPSIFNTLKHVAGRFFGSKRRTQRHVLDKVNAVFKPGTLTLILGQPGSGKSTLMKVLAGQFPMDQNVTVKGEISYNGLAWKEVLPKLPQLAAYVAQSDHHFPSLTVQETLDFAHLCCASDWEQRPDVIIDQFGLNSCRDTQIGSGLNRGVSGGESRRVTSGEMQFGMKCISFLDEISTGLDSATAFDIIWRQREIARNARKTIVMTLLQPTPEMFELFDSVLLLNDGKVLYNGPRDQVLPYFQNLGLVCPLDVDIADFLLDIATNQQQQYEMVRSGCIVSPRLPKFGGEFADRFRQSSIFRDTMRMLEIPPKMEMFCDAVQHFLKTSQYRQSFWTSTSTLIRRQLTITLRNRNFLCVRALMVVGGGLIYGRMLTKHITAATTFIRSARSLAEEFLQSVIHKRKRSKDNDYPDDSDEYRPSFEFVAETQDLDYEEEKTEDVDVEAVTEEHAQLPLSTQQPTIASTYRLMEITKDIHSSVICKLNRICRYPWLIEEIKNVCVAMKQIQLEGWHLANLHVLRCLKEEDDIPELEQMFFYRCCAATLGEIEKRDRPKKKTGHETFHKTCQLYWAGRERELSYEPELIKNVGAMINEMAKLMQTNALNMVALHFRRRLHQYIRFRYAGEGKLELKYSETKRLVASCYRVKSVPEKDDDGNFTGNTVKVWTKWDDTNNPVEKELRAWLEIVPWQWQIRANSAHFIRKLSDMLAYMEKFWNKHPNTKGARVYSLLPVSSSYQAAYVKLNASTLYGLLARRIHDPKVKGFFDTELSHLPFDMKAFQKNKSEILRKLFDVEQFETRNRIFVDDIKTNGYGASVTMIRPVTTTSVVVVEKQVSTKKRKKNDGTVGTKKKPTKKKLKSVEEIAESDTFAKELFKLGPEYSPKVLIGIDPGMRSLVTAVSTGRLPRRRRQKSRRGKHHRHRNRRGKRKEQVVIITTREYRHLARMNDFEFYNKNLKRREPWYASVIRAMPSFKTASYDMYFGHLQFFWKHLRFLLAFSAEQAFLRWRFTRDRAKMKAMDTLAKRLVPKASKQVCIGYGDWSQRDGIKGHATGPVKGFVKALKRRATVIPMDEYRTSITCSCCHKRLKQARLFNNLKRKKDEVDVRVKEHPSLKETKEIAEMSKFRNPKLANKKIVLKCTRNVLRCTNSRCKTNFWNRDVNAARNMLELLRSGLKGKHGAWRLRAFRRDL